MRAPREMKDAHQLSECSVSANLTWVELKRMVLGISEFIKDKLSRQGNRFVLQNQRVKVGGQHQVQHRHHPGDVRTLTWRVVWRVVWTSATASHLLRTRSRMRRVRVVTVPASSVTTAPTISSRRVAGASGVRWVGGNPRRVLRVTRRVASQTEATTSEGAREGPC